MWYDLTGVNWHGEHIEHVSTAALVADWMEVTALGL